MYRRKLKRAQPKLFTPFQRRRVFPSKRFRAVGLTLGTIVLSLIANTFSTPLGSNSSLVASAAVSTKSEWVRAVIEQGNRLDTHSLTTSAKSDWVRAVMAQGKRLELHSVNGTTRSTYPL